MKNFANHSSKFGWISCAIILKLITNTVNLKLSGVYYKVENSCSNKSVLHTTKKRLSANNALGLGRLFE